jgi:hypothetical protein
MRFQFDWASFRSYRTAIAGVTIRLRNNFTIAKRLCSDYAALVQQLRSFSAAITQQKRRDFRAIAQ